MTRTNQSRARFLSPPADGRWPWRERAFGDLRLHWSGREASVMEVALFLSTATRPTMADLSPVLAGLKGHFALVIETPDLILALTDKIRSLPLFYTDQDGELLISPSAETILEHTGELPIDHTSLLEFRMASYCTGFHTLHEGLRQIQAGEVLLVDPAEGRWELGRYYRFHSPTNLSLKDEEFIEAVGAATDAIFRRTVEDLAGRRVLLSLSAGLDSRLVLCKLLEHGHDNILAFTYGPPGNCDAKGAKETARRLNIPWRFTPYTANKIRKYFWSNDRRELWRYAGNRCSLPLAMDGCALEQLRETGDLREDDVVINGHSGDCISGSHLQGYHLAAFDENTRYDVGVILQAILRKHYSLNALLYPARVAEMTGRILDILDLPQGLHNRDILGKVFEDWGWQERQSKYIVNAQRGYEWLGLKWMLPLWDDEYMHFWPQVPYRLRLGQALYIRYLKEKDPYGLFRNFEPPIWNWQRLSMLALPVGRMVRLLRGKAAQEHFYRACAYFGRYSNHYTPFGLREHLRSLHTFNHPIGRYADLWLRENLGWTDHA